MVDQEYTKPKGSELYAILLDAELFPQLSDCTTWLQHIQLLTFT